MLNGKGSDEMGDRVSYLNLQTGEEIFTSKLWYWSSRVTTKTIHAIFLLLQVQSLIAEALKNFLNIISREGGQKKGGRVGKSKKRYFTAEMFFQQQNILNIYIVAKLQEIPFASYWRRYFRKRNYMQLYRANFILLIQKCVKLTLRKYAKMTKQECMERKK